MSLLISLSRILRWVVRLSYWSFGWYLDRSRVNSWMLAQSGWIWHTPGSRLFFNRTFDQKDICCFVSPSDKLLLYVHTAESKEEHFQDQVVISQQKGFLEKSNFFQLVLEYKTYYSHQDCYGYHDYTGLKTNMALVTVLALKPTFMAIVTVLASKPIWLL